MTTHPSTLFRQGYEAAQQDMNRAMTPDIPREPTESMIEAMISADADSNYGYETESAEKYLARLYRAAWDAAHRMNKKSDQDLMVTPDNRELRQLTEALRELVRYVQRLHNHQVPEGRVSTELIDALIILGKIDPQL